MAETDKVFYLLASELGENAQPVYLYFSFLVTSFLDCAMSDLEIIGSSDNQYKCRSLAKMDLFLFGFMDTLLSVSYGSNKVTVQKKSG